MTAVEVAEENSAVGLSEDPIRQATAAIKSRSASEPPTCHSLLRVFVFTRLAPLPDLPVALRYERSARILALGALASEPTETKGCLRA